MKKISILDQFAADVIGAPAVVTGGSGGCKVTKVKTVKCKAKSKSKGSKVKCGKSKSAKTSSSKCAPKPPVCWS